MTVSLTPGCLCRSIQPITYKSVKVIHDSPCGLTRLRAARDGQPLAADKYTRLFINGRLWMSDTDFECRSMRLLIVGAHGDVLVVGLGLGLMLNPLLTNPLVRSVTVLEISQDVIDVVSPYYQTEKLKVVRGDCRTWKAPNKAYDHVYLDVWENVPNEDDRKDIRALKLRFRSSLKKGGKVRAWCEEFANR